MYQKKKQKRFLINIKFSLRHIHNKRDLSLHALCLDCMEARSCSI
jgi:hypothetical protein